VLTFEPQDDSDTEPPEPPAMTFEPVVSGDEAPPPPDDDQSSPDDAPEAEQKRRNKTDLMAPPRKAADKFKAIVKTRNTKQTLDLHKMARSFRGLNENDETLDYL
jgi:hypothetical protein